MRPPPTIDTILLLKQKQDMLEDLGFMTVASSAIKQASKSGINPIDAKYNALNATVTPLSKKSETYKRIALHVKNSHGKTHTDYTLKIQKIYEISKKDDETAYAKGGAKLDNRKLLWHGSRITNWFGILSEGLQIAPPSAPVTGYMFGKGLYFADVVSKSANYCHASKSFPEGCCLLCEVALGNSLELTQAKYIDTLAKPYNSATGVGKTILDPNFDEEDEDGVSLSLGKNIDGPATNSSLQYNEFIVYKRDQCRMRYLIHFQFIFS